MPKKIFRDPGLWMLIAVNCSLVWYYFHHPEAFTTLVWAYWVQSVMLGMFNILDILTVRKIAVPVGEDSSSFTRRIPTALFFLVHYGLFHLVYSIFIYGIKPRYPFDFGLFEYCIFAFFFGQLLTFIRHKKEQRTHAVNLGTMFFIPYLRIIPMHLTILLPSFLGMRSVGIFLILKSLADVVMYIVTRPAATDKVTDVATLTSQQELNL